MQRQQNRPPPPAAQSAAASARQNEYFVPRDGIDREVITSDICRYLGNDALVRPGTYEAQDGRVTQGYFITAYRNLTSAMIQDLKADSARWEQERRAASRTSGAGAGGAREQPREQTNYAAWKNRQLDSNNAYRLPSAPPPMDVEMEMDYPPAVNPVGAGYAPAPYPPSQPPHGYAQPQYHPPPPNQFQQLQQPYGGMTPMSLSSAPPSRAFGATAGGPAYGSDADAYGYPSGSAVNPLQFQAAQPLDVTYGRAPGGAYPTATAHPPEDASDELGSPAGTAPSRPPFGAIPDPHFVDEHQSPALPNAPTPTNGTPSQIPPGPPAARRDAEPRERERERDHREHRTRRSEPDREDRHATERARHRHAHR
ncbi:hypothetical protein B0T18DRAFT_424119 [Schizothecium vesticola]|uniref:Transcription factor RfeG n=1 Tax=Schizothecium vesticola TaxID=314040 RepID=A0AA40F9B0_9PEZI|nr:hypothetical protein B0T18DRAFT_424119 [Schizothecium vesticola]